LTVRQFSPVSRAISDTLAPLSSRARKRRSSSQRSASNTIARAALRRRDHESGTSVLLTPVHRPRHTATALHLYPYAPLHIQPYPDITSFPGLGALSGARVLAEIGDDRSRFADARGLKAYAGSAPITSASGKSVAVLARQVKNQRLAAVGYMWAFAAMAHSDGARAHYDRRREASDRHTAAQRNLFNRMLGCLHHCLIHRVCYSESVAFPAPSDAQLAEAA
jgi:transposase